MQSSTSQRRKTTQTASHWGVYTVETDQHTHEVLSTGGVPFDPHPSPIQASLPEVVHDSLRIDQPYVREGQRNQACSQSCLESFGTIQHNTR
ncbi:MAG TPA: hypothetical protein VFA10_19620 [Ktedonobacteraceae bacterium]|nr:hypothetical protein [Ktedonobacteraceae bacterium]